MAKKRNEGFTLLELLVVVAIIAILALVVLLAINPAEMMRKSRDSQRLSDLGTIRRALDLALADGADLPLGANNTTDNAGLMKCDSTAGSPNFVGVDICKYLANIPQDPQYKAGDTTTVQTMDSADCTTVGSTAKSAMVYTFKTNTTGETYELNSYLEAKDNCETLGKDSASGESNKYETGTAQNFAL